MSFVSGRSARADRDNPGWLQPDPLTLHSLARRARLAYRSARASGERRRDATAFALLALVQQAAYTAGWWSSVRPARNHKSGNISASRETVRALR